MTQPCLQAVVESPTAAPTFLSRLPAKPWPSHVRLSIATTAEHVSLVVAQLAIYGHGQEDAKPHDLATLLADFPGVAPGGLAVVEGERVVFPSCCCGLERWRDWEALLTTGDAPWLGHDPSPWIELRGDDVLVWPDGGLGESCDSLTPITLSRSRLQSAIVQVEQDLTGFLQPLEEYCRVLGGALAREFCEAFAEAFVRPAAGSPTVRVSPPRGGADGGTVGVDVP